MKKLLLASIVFLLLAAPSLAHVGYVVNEQEARQNYDTDFAYLLEPLKHGSNLALMLGTLLIFSAIYFLLSRQSTTSAFKKFIKHFIQKAETYQNLAPWIMRLSLGIALLGAGTTDTLISPLLPNAPEFSLLQTTAGFLLLIGFLLTPATFVAIIIFMIALAQNIYLIGNLDFLALTIALLIMADPKPGIDDLIGIPFASPLKKLRPYTALILRLGIGGAFIFLAFYEKLLNPHLSALVVTTYHLDKIIPVSPQMWVLSVGLIEAFLGLCIVIGLRTRLAAIIAFIVLSTTFFFFKEAVYSHITLFGTLSLLLIFGSGPWSIDNYLDRWQKRPHPKTR